MARKLVCDGCGDDAPDTPENTVKWSRFAEHKLDQKLVVLHDWELCPGCSETIRATIARLFPKSGGSKPKEDVMPDFPPFNLNGET